MMRNRIFLMISLALVLTVPTLNAQKQWTLEECIKYALENNVQIKRQVLASVSAENDYLQAKMNVLPSLGASASHSFSYGRSIDIATNQFTDQNNYSGSVGAGADLVLFNGFRNFNNIVQKKYALQSMNLLADKTRDDITLNLVTGYLQILFNKELLEVAQSQYDLSLQQVEKTKKMVDIGNKARGDLMQMEAQAATEKLNVTNATNNLKISYLMLAQMLDMDSVAGFDILVPDNLEVSALGTLLSVDTIYDNARQSRPDVKLAESRLNGAETGLSLARSARYPELSVSGQLYSYYSQQLKTLTGKTVPDQLKGNISKGLGISLNIPLFNRYGIQHNIKSAKIEVEDAKLVVRQAELDLHKAIQQAHADAIASFDKYNSALESVKSNEEAFNYTEQKYNVGIVSFLDYNVSKTNLTKARADLVQAKYEFIFKTKILDFYMGNSIKL